MSLHILQTKFQRITVKPVKTLCLDYTGVQFRQVKFQALELNLRISLYRIFSLIRVMFRQFHLTSSFKTDLRT